MRPLSTGAPGLSNGVPKYEPLSHDVDDDEDDFLYAAEDSLLPTSDKTRSAKTVVDGLSKHGADEESGSKYANAYGYTVCLMAAVLDSLSMASVQFLDASIPDGQLNTFRYSAQILMIGPVFFFFGCDIFPERKYVKWLVLVAFLSNGVNSGRFAATYYLPLGTCSAVGLGLSMLMTWVVSLVFFRQPKWASLPGLVLAIAGITLITQPEVFFPVRESHVVSTNLSMPVTRWNCFSVCANGSEWQTLHDQHLHELEVEHSNASANTINCTNSCTALEHVQEFMNSITAPLYSKDEKARNTLKGYFMLCIYAVSFTGSNYIIHEALRDLAPMKLTFWMPAFALPFAALNMVSVEVPYMPVCYLCIIALVCHAFLTGGQSSVRYHGMQIVHPLHGMIIVSTSTTLLNFLLQYTLLSSLHPGHRNWLEYMGLGLTLMGLIVGPCLQMWIERRSNENKNHRA